MDDIRKPDGVKGLVDNQFFAVIRPFLKVQRYVRQGGGSSNPETVKNDASGDWHYLAVYSEWDGERDYTLVEVYVDQDGRLKDWTEELENHPARQWRTGPDQYADYDAERYPSVGTGRVQRTRVFADCIERIQDPRTEPTKAAKLAAQVSALASKLRASAASHVTDATRQLRPPPRRIISSRWARRWVELPALGSNVWRQELAYLRRMP